MSAVLVGLEFVARTLLAVGLAGAGSVAGYVLARRLLPRAPVAARAMATAIAGLYWLTCGFHVLLHLRRFDRWGAFALLAATLLLVLTAGRPLDALGAAIHRDRRLLARAWRRRRAPGLVTGATLACFTVLTLRFLVTPSFAWDSLTYHLTKAALWVQAGGPTTLEAPATWSMYAHYYGGGETLWAWAMLPFHSDLLVGVTDVSVWWLGGLAAWVLGRQMGLGAKPAATAAAFCISVPAVFRAAGSAYVDNLTWAALAAGLSFLALGFRRKRGGPFTLSAMALGLAAGAKLTAVPALVVAVGAVLVWRSTRGRRTVPLPALALALCAALVVFAPWPLDSLLATGNPIGGKPLALPGLRLQGSPVLVTYLTQRPAGVPYEWASEWKALVTMFEAPFGTSFGLFCLVPLALLPLGLWRWARREPWSAAATAAVLLSLLLFFWSPVFSVVRLGWAAVNARFLALAAVVAAPAGFLALPPRARRGYGLFLGGAAVVNLWHQTFLGWSTREWQLVLALAVLAGLLAALVGRTLGGGRPSPHLAALGALCVFLGAVQHLRDRYRYEIAAGTTVLHDAPKYWIPAAQVLDRPGLPLRIAATSGFRAESDHWFLYPLLGSRLQNHVVYVSPLRSGDVVQLDDPRLAAEAEREVWIARLHDRGVHAVFSFFPSSRELAWMQEDPRRFRPIHGDWPNWGAFWVVPPDVPGSGVAPAPPDP